MGIEDNLRKEQSNQVPLFLIDSSVLVKLFEGDTTSNEMLMKMFEMKKHNIEFQAITTISSFFNALWKIKEDVSVKHIQEAMDMINVGFASQKGFAVFEYKDDENIRNEIIDLAKRMSGVSGHKKD